MICWKNLLEINFKKIHYTLPQCWAHAPTFWFLTFDKDALHEALLNINVVYLDMKKVHILSIKTWYMHTIVVWNPKYIAQKFICTFMPFALKVQFVQGLYWQQHFVHRKRKKLVSRVRWSWSWSKRWKSNKVKKLL